jgi:hypothetical protein
MKSNLLKVGEVAGWYGALAIAGAYALVSLSIVPADGLIYQVLNLTGAFGIILIAALKGVRQSVALNIFWALIAIIALVRIAT